MLKLIEERIVGTISHLIVLVSLLFMIGRVIQTPLFPVLIYYSLLPNAALALLYVWRSRAIFGHVTQALWFQLWAMLLLGGQPWFWRMLAKFGVIGEKWFQTAAGPYHLFAAWGVMALILMFGALFVFSVTIEAMICAAYGKPFEYWLFGRMATRISDWLTRDDARSAKA
ncbi:MAG: hypothetical protein ACM3XM_10305 [Mycobacterium leprae]